MNDLKALYIYLIRDKKYQIVDWYNKYSELVENIALIRENLLEHLVDLNSNEAYQNTIFDNKEDLIKRLYFNGPNGVSSNGRSIVTDEMKRIAPENETFISNLTELIKEPNQLNHETFERDWHAVFGANNPIHVNRTTAACSANVSSTVNKDYFNHLFDWIIRYRYLEDNYEGGQDWYSKNVYLVESVREALEEIETDPYWINIFIWLIYENIEQPFSRNKQIVKYGAPGTGKTYKARELARMQFDIWKCGHGDNSDLDFDDVYEFVQFHPSYSYEDFIEGLRPKLNDRNEAHLQLQNGIFKNLCRKAGVWEIDIANWQLAEGTPEAFRNKQVEEITAGHIRRLNTQREGYWSILDGAEDHVLLLDLLPPYFIIIDEINRAELSRVFGELMYCMEYRGFTGAIKTQYAELNNEKTAMIKAGGGYKFFIPNNVYLYASMNTIDRSVDSFDFALRRRFKWEEVAPNIPLLKHHLNQMNIPDNWHKLADGLERLNVKISQEPILGNDYRIGHAYLWKLHYPHVYTLEEIRNAVWRDRIKSLLDEYLRGTGKESLIAEFKHEFFR